VTQADSWRFFAAARAAEARVEWPDRAIVLPFFESRADRQASRLVLSCDEGGVPEGFEYRLAPSVKVGLLIRTVESVAPPSVGLRDVSTSPLGLQFRRTYLTPGLKLEGQSGEGAISTSDESWPDLIVRRSSGD
jgi:hypothetical protein